MLLVKHQSTFETFLMPTLMPHPLAYVFKKELIYVPFFGWAMARLDMIHIDRSQRTQAFNKVVAQGSELLAQGIWIIMFPEGTRIPRGQKGTYKTGGTRLAMRDRRAGDPDRRHLGQGLAAQGLHQAPGRGRRVDRPAIPSVGPPARRADARGRGLDRSRDAPARSRGLRAYRADVAPEPCMRSLLQFTLDLFDEPQPRRAPRTARPSPATAGRAPACAARRVRWPMR